MRIVHNGPPRGEIANEASNDSSQNGVSCPAALRHAASERADAECTIG